ncbi:hypothetical protein [Ramlibacter sp.]|uniref:hypothetical protein n=1 Tax=Ramlibacter sp. TaxID=1917967 RepID=UPI002C8E6C5B|nr:hypothetical protein [Ramlibacter sp.]HWI83550.1 hypothetical protein [Ramlibacter sp.]
MGTPLWTPTLAWLAAAMGALMLAVVTPSETNLMGRLPSPAAQRLGQPAGPHTDRVLALVGFDRSHRGEINSWIRGLRLDQDDAINWVKMPVLNDPGTEDERRAVEGRIRASHRGTPQGSRVVPVFIDRDQFIRAAGLSGMAHASVLVIDRDGQVLARAEGQYDPDRASALRETLRLPPAPGPLASSFPPGK